MSEVKAATYVDASNPLDDQSLPVVCISHCWLQNNHPDPHGYNLQLVARALEARLEFLCMLGYRDPRLAVFYDFCSIHQNCRDRDGAPQAITFQPADGGLVDEAVGRFALETALFKQALESLGAFYSHPKTLVFMLTAFPPDYSDKRRYKPSGNVAPYPGRGWCFCESAWATMVKSAYLVMDLGVDPTNEMGGQEGQGWYSWWKRSSQGRGAPLLPDRFKEQLEDKNFTNGKDDKPLVAELYRKSFVACFEKATKLVYAGIGWGDAQAAALAAVLGAGAAPKLRTLECAPPARPRAPMQRLACVRSPSGGLRRRTTDARTH